MKVLIIEDEALTAKNLTRLLKQILPEAEILATLDSVAASVKWLNANPQPDLFFMDIQLADGVSFDIFEKVKIEKPVIFTTAYNEYAIRAFKVNSVDYLLKPIYKDQLQTAIEKFKRYFLSAHSVQDLSPFVTSYKNETLPKFKERFLVHYKSGMVPVPQERVAYFLKEAIIYLITTDNEKLVTDYSTIDEIEEVVNPENFYRANRQMIIHLQQVDTYKKHDTGKIEVHLKCSPNTRVDVSREKANEFVAWLDR
jgi:two-component system, LytTR family, response regulator